MQHFRRYSFPAILLSLLALLVIPQTACAGELSIYHQPNRLHAPYEDVTLMDEPPFAPDTALMTVDIVGITQGDCIIITCGDQRMLIDGGEGQRFQAVDQYLKKHGIDSFDTFFLTHAHDDHRDMQMRLIRNGYSVNRVISPYTAEDPYTLWVEYMAFLNERQIPWETVRDTEVVPIGDATLTIRRREDNMNINGHSAAAMLQFGNARMFLAADISGDTQRWLTETLTADDLRCDVYKVAHHGRMRTLQSLLNALSPSLAVITNSRTSTMNSDQQLDIANIPRYYITTGTIHLSTDGTQWYVWQEPID